MPFPNVTNTRFPAGVTNVGDTHAFADLTTTDLTKYHTFHEDFDFWLSQSQDWTITNTSGNSSVAQSAYDGGVIYLSAAAESTGYNAIQKKPNQFTFTSGKKTWFAARIMFADTTTATEAWVGLMATDTTPLVVTDGVYWRKTGGVATTAFYVTGSSTSSSATGISTIATNTWVKLSFYYDGESSVFYAVDDVIKGKLATTNLPTAALTVSVGQVPVSHTANQLYVDYVYCVKER